MRTPTNAIGFQVELLTPFGWRVSGFKPPYATREEAESAMAERSAAAPGREFRIMPALDTRP